MKHSGSDTATRSPQKNTRRWTKATRILQTILTLVALCNTNVLLASILPLPLPQLPPSWPACEFNTPLNITFEAVQTPGYPQTLHEWSVAEKEEIMRRLRVFPDNQTGRQRCIGGGAFDRIEHWVGPADQNSVDEFGKPQFEVNIRKRDRSEGYGSIASQYDNTIDIYLYANDSILDWDDSRWLVLYHEMTHAITGESFQNQRGFVSEGIAVFAELMLANEFDLTSQWQSAITNCELLKSPVIRSRDGLNFYNRSFYKTRYPSAACFFATLQFASRSVNHADGDFIQRFRERSAFEIQYTDSLDAALGAQEIQTSLVDSVPSCVAGAEGSDWLALQPEFDMDPDVPDLAIYVGPKMNTEFNSRYQDKVVILKRYNRPWGNSELPSGELALNYLNQDPNTPDSTEFYNVSVNHEFVIKNYRGEITYGPEPLDRANPEYLGHGTRHYLTTSLGFRWSMNGDPDGNGLPFIDNCSESEPPTPTHRFTTCKSAIETRVNITYDDPQSGKTQIKNTAYTHYINQGEYQDSLKGVFRNHSNPRANVMIGNSQIRVTLPDAGIQFDLQGSNGTFGVSEDTRFYRVNDTALPDQAGNCSLPQARAICSLQGGFNACPNVYEIATFDLANYHGLVMVERQARGLLVGPKVYTKVGDKLHLVY